MRGITVTVEARPMVSETTSTSTESALALLELPAFDSLSDAQKRGADCVWTRTRLTHETAIDLGDRPAKDGTTWFPRASRQAVLSEATYTLHYHTTMCEQCTDDAPQCEQGNGLLQLVREMRRP